MISQAEKEAILRARQVFWEPYGWGKKAADGRSYRSPDMIVAQLRGAEFTLGNRQQYLPKYDGLSMGVAVRSVGDLAESLGATGYEYVNRIRQEGDKLRERIRTAQVA